MAKKKLTAVITATTLALTSVFATSDIQAVSSLKLKNVSSKKTMYVGKTFKVKTNKALKNLTFKSSNKKVATINKKGVIKAKKQGTCKITVIAKISSEKTSKNTFKLTVKKHKVDANATPQISFTPNVSSSPTIHSTPEITFTPDTSFQPDASFKPDRTDRPGKPTETEQVEATHVPETTSTPETKPTRNPETTADVPNQRPTKNPEFQNTPSVEVSKTPTKEPTSSSSPASTPSATATPAPTTSVTPTVIPAETPSGSTFVTSIFFEENSVTLKDASNETVNAKDASNLTVNGTRVTISVPTNDTTNKENDKEIVVSGTCKEGQLVVDVDKEKYPKGSVELSFEDLTLSSSSTSPIYIASIDDECVISVKKGTTNTLSDGNNYTNEDGDTGVIYSKDDLKIKGKGSLSVTGNCGYGIISKNDLKVFNGTIQVTSVDASLKGKDSVKIGDKDDIGTDGAFDNLSLNLESTKGDCVRSNNPIDDETKVSQDSDYGDGKAGEIIINGGTITVKAYSDGFQSAGDLTVNGGSISIYTYQGAAYNASNNTNNSFMGRPVMHQGNTSNLEISAKGLKADRNLSIHAGTIHIDSSDDAIHCASDLTIKAGTLNLASGDDGIHSDKTLVIDGGTIDIINSYEGIEGVQITVNNGTIHLVSRDDGFNASDGSGESATRPGGGGFGGPNQSQTWEGNEQISTSTATCSLTINGGNILVENEGDGLDSNGNLYINGGTTLVVGPTSGGNGSIDIGDFGCTFECTGGIVLAVGYRDMAVTPTNTTNYLTRTLTSSGNGNIAIVNKDNQVLSVLEFGKSAQLLTYFNGNATASDCKVYSDVTYDGSLNSFGYGEGGTISGGTELTTSNSSNNNNFPFFW